MGMDIYGLKPKVKGKRPEIDWNKPTTEEERNKYFKKLENLKLKMLGIILETMFGFGDLLQI
jgi:hypothetical protein